MPEDSEISVSGAREDEISFKKIIPLAIISPDRICQIK